MPQQPQLLSPSTHRCLGCRRSDRGEGERGALCLGRVIGRVRKTALTRCLGRIAGNGRITRPGQIAPPRQIGPLQQIGPLRRIGPPCRIGLLRQIVQSRQIARPGQITRPGQIARHRQTARPGRTSGNPAAMSTGLAPRHRPAGRTGWVFRHHPNGNCGRVPGGLRAMSGGCAPSRHFRPATQARRTLPMAGADLPGRACGAWSCRSPAGGMTPPVGEVTHPVDAPGMTGRTRPTMRSKGRPRIQPAPRASGEGTPTT